MRLINNFGISRRMMMLASLASAMVFARVAVGPLTFTWLLIYLTGSQWSLANPHDYFTWILEAAPALIAFFCW